MSLGINYQITNKITFFLLSLNQNLVIRLLEGSNTNQKTKKIIRQTKAENQIQIKRLFKILSDIRRHEIYGLINSVYFFLLFIFCYCTNLLYFRRKPA